MKLMKVFDAPYEPTEVWEAWSSYNVDGNQRGYVTVWIDEELRDGYPDYEVEEGPWPYKVIYDWLIANGAVHGETVLVEYDW